MRKGVQLSPSGRRLRGRLTETLSFGCPLLRGRLQASAGNRLRASGDAIRIAATASGVFRGRGGGGRDFTHRGWTRGPALPLLFAGLNGDGRLENEQGPYTPGALSGLYSVQGLRP